MAASLAVTLALLVACLIGLGDGLTLREAQSDPQYYILYNQEPFNVGKQAGVASVVVFGTLTTVLASFAIIVRMFVRMGHLKKAIILNMSFLGIIAVALAICQTAYAITLQEGMADKEKYIFYDTSPFNVGMHAGLALLITYGILGTFTPTVMIITKILEKRRQRRKRTMSH
ncbi:unnamed protein product [Mesocestoides corti]|uniref:Uncharacterized protein n=1 Tax=Mesocestoides corti TaxID=53468 RepID=A0A0R3U4Q5_MESCO|nr:unnamed protein product [Mesocestoides corti]